MSSSFTTLLRGVAALLLLWCDASAARLYQWNDPRTGTTHLSGHPPAWYRKAGVDPMALPRVLVFDDGTLIDDTHRLVLRETPSALRANASAGAPAEATADDSTVAAAETEAELVERLRGILSDWDQRQTDRAKAILEEAGARGE